MSDYIWTFPTSANRWLWKPLALHLQKRMGARALLFVATEQDKNFYKSQFGQKIDEERIVCLPDPYDSMNDGGLVDRATIIGRAGEIERKYGISLMRDVVQADRHFGRGFVTTWNRAPGSHTADRTNFIGTLRACLCMFSFFEEFATSHPPRLAIGFGIGTGLFGKPVSLICRQLGVRFGSLVPGRIGDTFYWATDEFENFPELEQTFRQRPAPTEAEIQEAQNNITPPGITRALEEKKANAPQLRKLFKSIAIISIREAAIRIKGHRKSRTGYKAHSMILAPIREYFHLRMLNKAPFLKISELPTDLRYVYFPLQFEPEVSIQGNSPEASDQMAAINQIALSLPADVLLIVKEHPFQGGRRPLSVYRQIQAMPNAVMVRVNESSLEIIRRSSLVCTITSTAAYEAAVLGIPVAVFGRHGPLHVVPHVHGVKDYDDLLRIPEILDDSGPSPNRQMEGARYFHALRESSMDFSGLKFFARSDAPTEGELSLISQPLIKALSNKVNSAA